MTRAAAFLLLFGAAPLAAAPPPEAIESAAEAVAAEVLAAGPHPGLTIAVSRGDLVRNVVRGERSDWAGLFDSAVYRAP